ncbi:hypothetical protein D3C77_406370 [compost metagenome]
MEAFDKGFVARRLRPVVVVSRRKDQARWCLVAKGNEEVIVATGIEVGQPRGLEQSRTRSLLDEGVEIAAPQRRNDDVRLGLLQRSDIGRVVRLVQARPELGNVLELHTQLTQRFVQVVARHVAVFVIGADEGQALPAGFGLQRLEVMRPGSHRRPGVIGHAEVVAVAVFQGHA